MRPRLHTLAALVVLPSTMVAQNKEAAVDALMAAYARPGMPGAAVLVVKDGHVLLAKGYGLADVDSGVPVTPETNFRLASLSKQFTATVIMRLEAAHRLRYDDPIGKWLPSLPAYARGVTVRHLLNHTSGLPDYEDYVPDTATRQVLDADVPALIAHADSGYFAPGTRYRYSNTGYALLALIGERASGKRWPALLHDELFAPLGMSSTLARTDGGPPVPHRAYGHHVDASGGVTRTDQSSTSAVLGDGGIYTSVTDLAKWDAALERHTRVSEAAQRLAWTPPALAVPNATPYGFGWFVDTTGGVLRVSHNGESRGFTNFVLRYPERRLAVWVLTNRTSEVPSALAQRIADLFADR